MENNLSEQIAYYQEQIESNPGNVTNYWHLGLNYLLQGDESTAQDVWISALLQATPEVIEEWTKELVQLLDSSASEQYQLGNFLATKRCYTAATQMDDTYENKLLESDLKTSIDRLFQEALNLAESGQYDAAITKHEELLNLDPENATGWHNLALTYYKICQYWNAYQTLEQALKIDSSIGLHHYTMGLILEELNKEKAIDAYQEAIKLDDKLVDAYDHWAKILYYELNQPEEATEILHRSIAANPEHFGSYTNLGVILFESQQFDEAISIYQQALELKPNDPDILTNLELAYKLKEDPAALALYFGNFAYQRKKYQKAVDYFEQLSALETVKPEIYITWADCYKNLAQEDKMKEIFQKGIEQYPEYSRLYGMFFLNLKNFAGEIEEAQAMIDNALKVLPNDVSLRRLNQVLLPIVYDSVEEIETCRTRFVEFLDKLVAETNLDSPEAINDAVYSLNYETNFYLQYQGKDDLELQVKYGSFVHKVMAAAYPQWSQQLPLPEKNESSKIRLGFISSFFRLHTVGKLFLGWIQLLSRDKFEIYCYYLGADQDGLTSKYKLFSDVFRSLGVKQASFDEICETILNDRLSVLTYVDIGMDSLLTKLAGLRLAPIQCLSWGHPITSGSPTIDYYLSSDLMEPANGEQHYSERLIRLPNISISYPDPQPVFLEITNHKQRSDFNFREDAIIYLSCQSLYKYLPQYDYIFPAIAQKVPQAQFVFLRYHYGEKITEKFRLRLAKAFAEFGLNSEDYCVILPRLLQYDYFAINILSDIYLDTLSWSGGNTTLEAIGCDLPVVTCPGEFMRGRHSSAILQMLGVRETIAQTEAEYIDIAVRLGLDPEWRQTIREKMAANHASLYGDRVCIDALDAFYLQAIEEYSA